MAWHDCPACGSHMETVEDDSTGYRVESCPDRTCGYHVKPSARDRAALAAPVRPPEPTQEAAA